MNLGGDTGLSAIVVMAKMSHLHADIKQIEHAFALDELRKVDTNMMILIAKSLKLKARRVQSSSEKLKKHSLPVIAKLLDGNYTIIAQYQQVEESFVILDLKSNKPILLSEKELITLWDGELILCAKSGFQLKEEVFGLKWFIPSIIRPLSKPHIDVNKSTNQIEPFK